MCSSSFWKRIVKITNAQRELAIEEFCLRCAAVERKDLITKMKSMLVDNDHPNNKDENARKFFDPKLLTANDWSKDNLDETLVKIYQMRSSRLVKENDKLKKETKYLLEKISNQKEHLLGTCWSLWEESHNRDREKDDSALGDSSTMEIAIVENFLQKSYLDACG